jgi:hypothetical protein
VERIVSTIDLLDELPTAALEEVRNFCTDYNKGRKGEFSEFKRAFIALVVAHLNNVRLEESRLFHGITGLPERGRDELDERLAAPPTALTTKSPLG